MVGRMGLLVQDARARAEGQKARIGGRVGYELVELLLGVAGGRELALFLAGGHARGAEAFKDVWTHGNILRSW